jgi:hydroxypyruvate reductase
MIEAALRAADPKEAIRRHVRREGESLFIDDVRYDLRGKEVRLVAVGKASAPMASAMIEWLNDKISRGVVVTKYEHLDKSSSLRFEDVPRRTTKDDRSHVLSLSSVVYHEAAHPVPDENSLLAGELVCDLLKDCNDNTLVVACVSGGASALMISPREGISLKTMQAINDALLKSGADIHEINSVRLRLERLKGGGLVRLAQPAQVIGLILSDVIGDPLDIIASGLTNDARARNILVGNNAQSCAAVAEAARKLGYDARIVTTNLRGEAREAAKRIVTDLMNVSIENRKEGEVETQLNSPTRPFSRSSPLPLCLIYGGETTVTIRGEGKGGRNQELALAAAIQLGEVRRPKPKQSTKSEDGDSVDEDNLDSAQFCVVALGTDGTDGPTDAAGAVATSDTLARAAQIGLNAEDFLSRNDSYHFFRALGDLIITGQTGTNVADVVIAIRYADTNRRETK